MSILKAQVAEAVEDRNLNVFEVAFASDPSGEGEQLHLQIALEVDEQDRRLGHDTYSLCREPGQITHYGGVEWWRATRGTVRLRFTEEAATMLGMDSDLIIEFPAEDSDEIIDGLRRVLGLQAGDLRDE